LSIEEGKGRGKGFFMEYPDFINMSVWKKSIELIFRKLNADDADRTDFHRLICVNLPNLSNLRSIKNLLVTRSIKKVLNKPLEIIIKRLSLEGVSRWK